MNFLPDVFVTCEVARTRYNVETLTVRFKATQFLICWICRLMKRFSARKRPGDYQKLKTLWIGLAM